MKRCLLIALMVAMVATTWVQAQDEDKDVLEPAAPAVDARYEKFTALVGDWKMADKDDVMVTYHLTAGGTTLVETLFPGQESEMVTIYHMDNEALVATHYCSARNQPRLIADREMKENTLSFSCDGKPGNTKDHNAGHMHHLKMTFVDADHVTANWTFQTDGEDADPVVLDVFRGVGA